jgi:hypothetical protein
MSGGYARWLAEPGYPWARTLEQHAAIIEQAERAWGDAVGIETSHPSMAHDERYRQWWARRLRASASPSAAARSCA